MAMVSMVASLKQTGTMNRWGFNSHGKWGFPEIENMTICKRCVFWKKTNSFHMMLHPWSPSDFPIVIPKWPPKKNRPNLGRLPRKYAWFYLFVGGAGETWCFKLAQILRWRLTFRNESHCKLPVMATATRCGAIIHVANRFCGRPESRDVIRCHWSIPCVGPYWLVVFWS